MNLSRTIWVALLLISAFACQRDDDSTGSGIPLVAVNIQISVNDPNFINLQVPGGWDYITGGSRGILLYRLSQDQIMAFDRHCPYQPDNNCSVRVDSSGITAVDEDCCGSEFIIVDGSITKGPAAFPLHQYRTEFDGTILRIFN